MFRYFLLIAYMMVFPFLSALSTDASGKFIDQKLGTNRYSVTYIELETTSSQEALQYALEHAAGLVKQDGYRYFTLDSRQEVILAESQNSGQAFYGNMYEEKIIQRDWGKSSIKKNTSPSSVNTYPGLKITLSSYKEKPWKGKVYDVCDFVPCN